MNGLQILTGDCREVLPSLEAGSVQMCCTSPPYWNLRDYGTAQWEGGDAVYKCDQCGMIQNAKKLRNLSCRTSQAESKDMQSSLFNETYNKESRTSWTEMENTGSGSPMEQDRPSESMGGEKYELEGREEEELIGICGSNNSVWTSESHKTQIHDGTPISDGEKIGPISGTVGGSASSEWNQRRQSDRKLTVGDEESASRRSRVSSLREEISDSIRCECGGNLLKSGCDHAFLSDAGMTSQRQGRSYQQGHPHRDCHCGARRIDAQLGLEATPEEYIANMVAVFREVWRVLRDDGTLWLNLGDSYASSGIANLDVSTSANLSRHGDKNCNPKMNGQAKGRAPTPPGLKPKDLCMMPARVALALQADGWWVRSTIIWHKPNPMPESVTDRPTTSHEYIFLLTKQERYFYDAEAIREPLSEVSLEQIEYFKKNGARSDYLNKPLDQSRRDGDSLLAKCGRGARGEAMINSCGRNKRSVWTIATQPYAEAHFATFPEEIPKLCILAGSKPGDTVLDPFAGSGTVGKVVLELGRRAILIELNPAYIELAKDRTFVTPGFL